MAEHNLEQALQAAKTECATLAEQLRQTRVDLHRLGAQDMNRMLVAGAVTSAAGVLVGLVVGFRIGRNK